MQYERKTEGHGYLIKWIIGLGDLVVINLSFIILYQINANLQEYLFLLDNTRLGSIFLLINLVYFITASIVPIGITSNIIFLDKIFQKSISFISLYFVIFTAGYFLLQMPGLYWTTWFMFFVGICITYSLWHIIVRSILKTYRNKGYNYKRVIIVGCGKNAENIYHEIKSGDYGYKILGFFNNLPDIEPNNKNCNYLGTLSQLEKYCVDNKVDEIYCTLPSTQEADIIKLVNFAERNMIRFLLVPDFYEYVPRKLVLNFLQSTPIIAIRPEPLQLLSNRFIKRAFDILFSLLVLITIFPIVFIVFSILIKISSSGPIFFKQQRTGLQGKAFSCYKFRSMKINKESDTQIATKNDPRITRVGKFMRRTSIDELPQFFNVLIGNMSVVGPRPHMVKQTSLYKDLIDKFMIRHIVKPGITGWAQISGYRGETKRIEQMEGRFKKDIWYIENWSFVLDLKIIVVTVWLILKGDDKAR